MLLALASRGAMEFSRRISWYSRRVSLGDTEHDVAAGTTWPDAFQPVSASRLIDRVVPRRTAAEGTIAGLTFRPARTRLMGTRTACRTSTTHPAYRHLRHCAPYSSESQAGEKMLCDHTLGNLEFS
jgi:hypothetical protein